MCVRVCVCVDMCLVAVLCATSANCLSANTGGNVALFSSGSQKERNKVPPAESKSTKRKEKSALFTKASAEVQKQRRRGRKAF